MAQDSQNAVVIVSAESAHMRKQRFKEMADAIADLAREIEVKIVPYYDPDLKVFSALSAAEQERINFELEIYLDAHLQTKSQGFSLLDSGQVVWNFLKRIGCRPTSDLFSFFHPGNVVEIHDLQLVQIFRNFTFFRYCSYSVEDLYCSPFHILYKRESSIESKLLDTVASIHRGEVSSVIPLDLAPHIISEVRSVGRMRISAELKYIAPLFWEGGPKVAGSIIIEEGKIL